MNENPQEKIQDNSRNNSQINSQKNQDKPKKKPWFVGGFWQFTPLGKISPEVLEKKLSKEPIRLFIPTVPLPAIEIKYLGIQFGRFVTSVLMAILLTFAISSSFSQNAFQAQVVDRFLPKLQIPFSDLKFNFDTNEKDFNRFFNNNLNNLNNDLKAVGQEISNAPKEIEDYAKREFWRRFWFSLVVGGGIIGLILRGVFFYLLISILYKNNRNDWKSLERELAKQKFGMAKVTQSILQILSQNLGQIANSGRFSQDQIQQLQALTNNSSKNQSFSQEEINLLIQGLRGF